MILRHSDVTPREIYWNRRKFLSASAATLGSLALSPFAEAAVLNASKTGALHNLGNNKLPPKNLLTSHNNYYEFGMTKSVVRAAQALAEQQRRAAEAQRQVAVLR